MRQRPSRQRLSSNADPARNQVPAGAAGIPDAGRLQGSDLSVFRFGAWVKHQKAPGFFRFSDRKPAWLQSMNSGIPSTVGLSARQAKKEGFTGVFMEFTSI
jgi:hypothetical protein